MSYKKSQFLNGTVVLNHPYLTKNGWEKLKDIEVGEKIVCVVDKQTVGKEEFSLNTQRIKSRNMQGLGSKEKPRTSVSADKHRIQFLKAQDRSKDNGIIASEMVFQDEVISIKEGFPLDINDRDVLAMQVEVEPANGLAEVFGSDFLFSEMPIEGRGKFSYGERGNDNFIFGQREYFIEDKGSFFSAVSLYQSAGIQKVNHLNLLFSSDLGDSVRKVSLDFGEPTMHLSQRNGFFREPFLGNVVFTSFYGKTHFDKVVNSNFILCNRHNLTSLSKNTTSFYPSQANLITPPGAKAAQRTDSPDILWDKIISIEPLGNRKVYDIEVEGTHNFVAEGIVAHNTYINGDVSKIAVTDTASIPSANLDSPESIRDALSKIKEQATELKGLNDILSFIIENHSLHEKDKQNNPIKLFFPERIHEELLHGSLKDLYQNLTEEERAEFLRILDDLRILPLGVLPVGVKGILDRLFHQKPQAEIEISRPDTNIVKESPIAFEYISSSQKFQGVDLEHFVHAQRRLARKELSREELRGVLKKLSLKQELANEDKLDLAYAAIYKELARGNYNKDIIDTINGFDPSIGKSTYSDPRLNIAIIDQSGDARSQGVYEAVSNSLDALGFKIGQFGKGVKQIIDWLEPTGKDRIDVYSKKENEPAYQLTILKDTKGQNYLQIQRISDSEFRDITKAVSARPIDTGTIVKVTTQNEIPLEDSQHREQNSQSAIAAGIHKRFPFITNVPIIIQIGNQEPQRVNGFREKKFIVPVRQKTYHPKEKEDDFVHVRLDKHNIAIVDNGAGMDARVLSGMFVPEGGTKSPEFLSGRQIDEELGKVEVVHDKNLPHRVSFARNGRVDFTVNIPEEIHPDATLPGAGGLMLELGSLLDIQESHDRIVLNVGKENRFQKGVIYAVNQILKHPELSAVDKIRYINTIVIGLDGLIKGNENNAEVIKAIRQNILAELQAVIEQLRKDDFVVLPY